MWTLFSRPKKDAGPELITCRKCKHLIQKEDAKIVTSYPRYRHKPGDTHYYCPSCAPKYDIEDWTASHGPGYFKIVPASERRVNKDGTEYTVPAPVPLWEEEEESEPEYEEGDEIWVRGKYLNGTSQGQVVVEIKTELFPNDIRKFDDQN